MAIIYPSSCRNITSGALRQIKQQGYSTNTQDGGVFSTAFIRSMQAHGTNIFAKPNEPLGIFMTALEQAQKDIEGTSTAISATSRQMVHNAETATSQLTESSRKMRDATDKLTTQMQKFNSIFTNAHFAEQSKAAQSLADAMERLAVLQEKGLLANVMDALKNTR